jgi:hypothetical protein
MENIEEKICKWCSASCDDKDIDFSGWFEELWNTNNEPRHSEKYLELIKKALDEVKTVKSKKIVREYIWCYCCNCDGEDEDCEQTDCSICNTDYKCICDDNSDCFCISELKRTNEIISELYTYLSDFYKKIEDKNDKIVLFDNSGKKQKTLLISKFNGSLFDIEKTFEAVLQIPDKLRRIKICKQIQGWCYESIDDIIYTVQNNLDYYEYGFYRDEYEHTEENDGTICYEVKINGYKYLNKKSWCKKNQIYKADKESSLLNYLENIHDLYCYIGRNAEIEDEDDKEDLDVFFKYK